VGASRNWVHQTPKLGEHNEEDDSDNGTAHFYASSAPMHYYPQYGPYYSNPYYYAGPPTGSHYNSHEYAAGVPRGYPMHMSPQRGHPVYAQRPHPYYYD